MSLDKFPDAFVTMHWQATLSMLYIWVIYACFKYMHFWEQFILMSETYVRGSVIKDFTCWSERTLRVFLKNIELESFKLWFTRWTGFLKLTKKWKIYAKWFIYIFMHIICILYRDFAIMGMCLNKVLVRRIYWQSKLWSNFNKIENCVSKVGKNPSVKLQVLRTGLV